MKRSFIQRKVLQLYAFVFRERPGKDTRMLISHFQTLTFGTGLAGFILYIFTIYAARHMGPASYGIYALVMSLSSFFLVPMLFGMHTSLINLLNKTKSPTAKMTLNSTAIFVVCATITFVAIFLLLIGKRLLLFFHVPASILIPTILMAAALSLYYISDGLFRALLQSKTLAILRLLQATIFAFLVFLFMRQRSGARVLILATFFATVFYVLCALWTHRSHFGKPSLPAARLLLHYGAYALMGTISGALTETVDKVILLHNVGEQAVGIYAAYQFVSILLVGKLLGLFLGVVFPYSSGHPALHQLMPKFNRIVLRCSILLVIVVGFLQTLLLAFYGDQYNPSVHLIVLFSLASGLYFFVWARCLVVYAAGIEGARAVGISALFFNVIQITLGLILIPRLSITGAILATIAALAVLGLLTQRMHRRFFTHINVK